MASEEEGTVPALIWQFELFLFAKCALLRVANYGGKGRFVDVTEEEFWVDVVVARIYIAIMFHDHGITAGFAEDAKCGLHAHPGPEHNVKNLHKDLSDVLLNPAIENG